MPLAYRSWFRPLAAWIAAAGAVCACAGVPPDSSPVPGAEEEQAAAAAQEPAAGGQAYRVEFTGTADTDLLELLRASSTLLALEGRPPASAAALDNRIAGDRERLDVVLRSQGYYDGRIDTAIGDEATAATDENTGETTGGNADETAAQTVTLTITPGEAYRLEAYRIIFVGEAPRPVTVPLTGDLGIVYGEVAKAKAVVEAENRLLRELADAHRPLARVVERKVIVDHDTRRMRVAVEVDAGPPARFGVTTITGLDRTQEDYARALLPWQQGEPFRQQQIDLARRRLLRSGLFDAVETQLGDAVDEAGELPVTIRLVEGRARSISAGAKYSTTEGPGGDVVWEHRNLFGSNEKLTVKAEANRFTQKLSGLLTRPNWRRPDRELLLGVAGTHTNSTAFDEWGGEVSARIRSPLDKPWLGAIGPSLEASQIKDNSGERSLVLVGLPVSLIRDDTTDKLDPRSGTRLRLQTTPYTGYFQKSVTFLENVVTASGYLPLDAGERAVLAGRVKVGSIIGESREAIPANKRFYAGGGDSIRGYRYQKVGPLDENNDPIGGRSLFEFSTEVRGRVWGNFGVVGFVDGGTAYSSVLPSWDETIRFAAGPGLRYLTPIGPVRFDVAFPLNGRSDIDDPYEFYISLGQSF